MDQANQIDHPNADDRPTTVLETTIDSQPLLRPVQTRIEQ
jgi:hypothetical protein